VVGGYIYLFVSLCCILFLYAFLVLLAPSLEIFCELGTFCPLIQGSGLVCTTPPILKSGASCNLSRPDLGKCPGDEVCLFLVLHYL